MKERSAVLQVFAAGGLDRVQYFPLPRLVIIVGARNLGNQANGNIYPMAVQRLNYHPFSLLSFDNCADHLAAVGEENDVMNLFGLHTHCRYEKAACQHQQSEGQTSQFQGNLLPCDPSEIGQLILCLS